MEGFTNGLPNEVAKRTIAPASAQGICVADKPTPCRRSSTGRVQLLLHRGCTFYRAAPTEPARATRTSTIPDRARCSQFTQRGAALFPT